MNKKLYFLFLLVNLFFDQQIFAQPPISAPINNANKIFILGGNNSIRFITLNDSVSLKTIASDVIGGAIVKQGNTILSGDSISLNEYTNIAEVFGHVHINDADTVNTYSDYLKYLGKEQIAYLKKDVKLTDGKASLFTNDLE